jgi:hypothetical protein
MPMNSVFAPTPLRHLSTGFPLLDQHLQGGYPCGAITALIGHPHATKAVAASARAVAHHQGLAVGYIRALDFSDDPFLSLQLWSTATWLLFESLDLLVLEALTPTQLAAMPATLAGLLRRRHRTLLVTLTTPIPCRAALYLRFEPKGWLYRRRQVYGYRAWASWRTKKMHTIHNGITLKIPVPPTMDSYL